MGQKTGAVLKHIERTKVSRTQIAVVRRRLQWSHVFRILTLVSAICL